MSSCRCLPEPLLWRHARVHWVLSSRFLSMRLSGFVRPTLCTTSMVQDYISLWPRVQRWNGPRSDKGSKQRQVGSWRCQVDPLYPAARLFMQDLGHPFEFWITWSISKLSIPSVGKPLVPTHNHIHIGAEEGGSGAAGWNLLKLGFYLSIQY